MKRNLWKLLLPVLAVVLGFGTSAYASSKYPIIYEIGRTPDGSASNVSKKYIVEMTAGKTYKCDLDGNGSKEKIVLKNSGSKRKLYINSKCVLTVKKSTAFFFFDLDKTDRTHEIYTRRSGAGNNALYRYKKKKFYMVGRGLYGDGNYLKKNLGDGTFLYGGTMGQRYLLYYANIEGLNANKGMQGSLGVFLKFMVKGGKICLVTNHYHDIESAHGVQTAAGKLPVYKKPVAAGSPSFYIRKGQKYTFSQIHFYNKDIVFFKVRISGSNKTGWVPIPASTIKIIF